MPRFQGTPVDETPAAGAKKPRFGGTPVESNQPKTAYDPHIEAAAEQYGIPVPWLKAQIQAESNFNPVAVSPAGARGLMQLMPETAKELGVTDPFNPAQNINAGAKYMRKLLDASNNSIKEALAKYNWGMGNVQRKGLANMPKETRDYIDRVTKGAGVPWYGKVIKGMADPLAGAMQLAAKVPDPVGDRIYEQLGMDNPRTTVPEALEQEEQIYQKRRDDEGIDWPRMAGNMLSPSAMALGGGAARIPALATGGLGRAALQGAVTGAAEGGLQPTYDDKSFWSDKAKQALAGGVMGGVFTGATDVALKGVGHAMGAAKGVLRPDAAEMMNLSKQFDVPITASDIGGTGKKVAAKTEAVLERVPFVGIEREVQQKAGKVAVEGVQKKLRDEMTNLSFQSLDKIQQVAQQPGPRAAAARRLLQEAQNAGDDWQKVIQSSGNLRAFRMQLGADELYDDVARLAAGRTSPAANTSKMLDQIAQEVDAKLMPDTGTANFIARLQGRIDNDEVTKTFEGLRQLRSDIGAELSAAKSSQGGANAVVSNRSASYLAQLKEAVEQDLDDLAKGSPELKAAWERANSFYRNKVVPYKSRDLAKALVDQDADDIYKAFLNQGKNGGQRFYQALDERGRSAVRYGMVTEALEKATDPSTGNFNPRHFASQMNRMQDAQGIYFKGDKQAEIRGLTKLMDHMERASMTQTGADFGGVAIGYGVGVGAAPATVTVLGMSKFLLTTRPGMRILYSANMLKPGSKGMQLLVDGAQKAMEEVTMEGFAPRAAESLRQRAPLGPGRAGGAMFGSDVEKDR